MRPLHELTDRVDPAWPLVESWIRNAEVDVEFLTSTSEAGEKALLATQVSTRSPMGAIAYSCAGLMIDSGWLRILGAGGHPSMQRSLPEWNRGRSDGYYLIADDIVGGSFAINGGALGEDIKSIYYFAPDSLNWEPHGGGYSDFVVWAMSPKIRDFYSSLRWTDWQLESRNVSGDQMLNYFPPLFAKPTSPNGRSCKVITADEQFRLQFDFKRQLDAT